ncbi:MAG: winged helix-turn-helix transcriptional regulator [Candidatus Thermoplasmatota archaeon]
MDRTPRPSLARRLPRALLVTALSALVLGGGIGFATAATDQAEVFAIAPPRGGDRAVYDVQSGEVSYEAGLETLPVAPLRLLDGRGASAYTVIGTRISGSIGSGETTYEFESVDVAAIDAATHRVLSVTQALGQSFGLSTSGTGPVSDLTGSTQETWSAANGERRDDDLFADPPCGALSTLQWEPAAVGDEILVPGCAWDPRFRVVRFEPLEGVPSVVAHSTSRDPDEPDGRVRLWFQAGVPYPVRIEFGTGDDPGIIGTAWRLTGFAPGDQELVAGETPADIDLPKVVDGEASRLGPDASGFPMTYPLQQAWDESLAGSQRLRDLVAAHEDWFLESASYSEERQDGEVRPAWSLDVRGGAETVRVGVTPHEPSTADTLLPLAAATGLWSGDHDNVRVTDGFGVEVAWPDFCLQERMPTVASVAARWTALEQAAEPANAFSFERRCFNEVPRTIVYAGDNSLDLPSAGNDPLPSTQPSNESIHQVLTLLGEGTDGRQVQRVIVEDHARSSWGPLQSPQPARDAGPTTVTRAGTWVAPSPPVAAGLTFLSLLVGALYWLWPAVKGGSFGLFSRLQAPDLLDHPVRKELLQRIEAQPGVHYQDLVRAMGMGKGAIEHHLRKLQEGGHVKAIASAGYTCWFPVAYDRRLVAAAPALKSEGARAVFGAIQARPGTSARDVGLATGLSPAAVNHHLQRLSEAGLVRIVRAGRSLSIMPTELASQVGAAAGA